MHTYGLIGRSLSHSFSPRYFAEKFEREGIANAEYRAFELASMEEFPTLLEREPTLRGLNVTIPYKEVVMPYLDDLSEAARSIGAVNTIAFEGGKLVGHNTDVLGFEQSLKAHWRQAYAARPALVLGTGGAAKAVCFVLDKMGVDYTLVSRTPTAEQWSYADLDAERVEAQGLIVHTTPLGTYPDVKNCPPLPYTALGSKHLLFDLIYNPTETLFLQRGRAQGAATVNGWDMLCRQAEAAWRIWNTP